MVVAREMSRCPFCKEAIIAGAAICKHCRSELASRSVKPAGYVSRVRTRLNTFRTGFLVGVAFSLVIVILIYRHFG